MDLKRLADRAKALVEKRGGTESVKEDARELKDIAGGRGSVTDKAKAAADALKEPGAQDAGDEPVADTTSPGVAAAEEQHGEPGGSRRRQGREGDGRGRGRR